MTTLQELEDRLVGLADRMIALEERMNSLVRRMDLREAREMNAPTMEYEGEVPRHESRPVVKPELPKTDATGNVPRGKYTGRTHDYVVEEDPWHVVWLADNNRAAGLGYTQQHIETAEYNVSMRGERRATR